MFGWLSRVFNWGVSNIGGAIIDFIRDVINGVWGVLNTLHGNVSEAWGDMFAAGYWLWQQTGKFGEAILTKLYHLYRTIIPAIIRWARRELNALNIFITKVLRWADREFRIVIKFINRVINDVRIWVIRDIYRPLFGSLEKAWHWIFNEGATLWYYLTHLDKFIDLIWDYLLAKIEAEAWNAGKILGKFFLSLFLHNIRRFALLLEDIIMAVM